MLLDLSVSSYHYCIVTECYVSTRIQMKTHKDCTAMRLENEVVISPVKLLELKFLLVIMKEGRGVDIFLKII